MAVQGVFRVSPQDRASEVGGEVSSSVVFAYAKSKKNVIVLN